MKISTLVLARGELQGAVSDAQNPNNTASRDRKRKEPIAKLVRRVGLQNALAMLSLDAFHEPIPKYLETHTQTAHRNS